MTAQDNQPTELALKNSIERITLYVRDPATNVVADAAAVRLRVVDMADTTVLQDDFLLGYGNPPTLPTHIVKPLLTTGQYYFPFGDISFDPKNTTSQSNKYVFVWSVDYTSGAESANIVQVVKVISAQTLSLVPLLRSLIDKARKGLNDDPTNPCLVGYSDVQLVEWLELGLTAINAAQPYPVWCHIDDFPACYQSLLIDSALITGLTAQAIFAIDTDIDSYSDQGVSFVINHHPKLLSMLQFLAAKLDKAVPAMKLHFVNNGSVYTQQGPNFRLQQLMQAAPGGMLFRNLLTSV